MIGSQTQLWSKKHDVVGTCASTSQTLIKRAHITVICNQRSIERLSLCGYPFKYYLDAYKGFHQIQMAEGDEEKTTFHTIQGVYCYTNMPFPLKKCKSNLPTLSG